MTHIEEDIYIAQELEDHQVDEKPVLTDIVLFTKQLLKDHSALADFLAVQSSFVFADQSGIEAVYLSMQETGKVDTDSSPSTYTLPLEKKFATILIAKMMEIGFLVASATSDRNVSVEISQDVDKKTYLKVVMPNPTLTAQELPDFFVLNNPLIGQKTHLQFGSGLEGFIFRKLCTLLHIPYHIEIVQNNAKISLEITLLPNARMI